MQFDIEIEGEKMINLRFSADVALCIKDKEGLSKQYQEHFSNLLNRPSSVSTDALEQISKQPILA